MQPDRQKPKIWKSDTGTTIRLTVCCLLCLLSLAACSNTTTAPLHKNAQKTTPSLLDGLVTPGYLTVGTSPNEPPLVFMDPSTRQASGFDMDLIKAIATRMNLQVKIVPTSLKTLIPDLRSGRFDVAIAGLTIDYTYKQEIDFIPYFSLGESLLVQKGNPHAIQSLADLCGQSVGTQSNTTEQADLQIASAACTEGGQPAITNVVLQDQNAVIQLLATNRVVATYQDSPVADYYLAHNSSHFELAGSVVNATMAGIAVSNTGTSIQNAVQSAFDQVKREGTYRVLLEKWGLTSGAITMGNRQGSF